MNKNNTMDNPKRIGIGRAKRKAPETPEEVLKEITILESRIKNTESRLDYITSYRMLMLVWVLIVIVISTLTTLITISIMT